MNKFFTSKTRWISLAGLLVVAALTLTACGAQGPTVVHVRLSEFKVEMDKASIPAGPVKFVIENAGLVVHELVLEPGGAHDEPFELNGKESEAEDIEVGKTVDLEWTIDSPGEYQLSCYTVGHFEQGMTTTFTVTAAP